MRNAPPVAEPRAVCVRCRRPQSVCYCRHLTSLETRTRVVLLQHPRERDKPIGTAHMASLCLPNAELHVGVDWSASPALRRALSDPARPAALLYPGKGAIDVGQSPPLGPVTLVVVDGTWWQTKKIVRENPELATLPRYSFTPEAPSEYRIRREPDESYVSTIEALVHVLGVLEGDPERFRALMVPFRAMIDAQIECQGRLHGARVRHAHARGERHKRANLPGWLRERAGDLVCAVGEANAWPYRPRSEHPDEIIHWVAHRLSTGETFDCVVAPRRPLAPRTTSHTGLDEEVLAAGMAPHEMVQKWREFVRETDILCTWGRYATTLFAGEGGYLLPARHDLRQVARAYVKDRVGTMDDFAARIATSASCALPAEGPGADGSARGRGGLRLAQLTAIAAHLSEVASRPF